MSRPITIGCLLTAYLFTLARAQGTTESTSRLITTIESTVTVVPVAYPASTDDYLPADPTPTCDVGRVTCPVCDGEDIDIDGGSSYKVRCDASLSSNSTIIQPEYITPNQCLLVCDSADDCVGTTLASNGSCALTLGSDYRLGSSDGYIAFLQNVYIPSNSSNATNSTSNPLASKFFSSATIPITYPTAYSNASNTPILHPPKPYYTNFTLPNSTYSANSSVPVNTTCSIKNPTCPACDNQTLTDMHNVTYTVSCGYKLDATLDWAFGEPLPAAYCMARCDERNVTCLGASWSTEECVLALGSYIKVEDPDHMAFIRVIPPVPLPSPISVGFPRPPISTGLSYTNMSRYDGGSLTMSTIWATNPTAYITPTVTDPPIAAPSETSSDIPTETSTSTPEPTIAPAQTYSPPPWTHGGGYGEEDGNGHHRPHGSSWQGGRPPWAHWGKPSWGHWQGRRRG